MTNILTTRKWKKALRIIRVVIAVVLLIVAFSCLRDAIRYEEIGKSKLDYYQDDTYPILNKNVYVGGDAYNFIINGTYFTAWSTLASGMYVSATICGCTGILLLLLPGYFVESPHEKQLEPGINADGIIEDLPEL